MGQRPKASIVDYYAAYYQNRLVVAVGGRGGGKSAKITRFIDIQKLQCVLQNNYGHLAVAIGSAAQMGQQSALLDAIYV